MPRVRTALTRGVVTVLGSPVLVIAPILYVFGVWLMLIAVGYQGPFAPLANLLALPPIGTSLDATLQPVPPRGLFGIIVFPVARHSLGAPHAAARCWRTARSTGTPASGLRVPPAICIIGVGILTVSSFFGPLLGPGFGILVQVGALVLGLYLFAFAPVIAVDEGRTMPDSLARSIRAARIPGTGNLTLAVIYVVPSIAVIVAPGEPGSLMGVNPSIAAWVFVLLIDLLHLILLATFAFRYLSVAHEVPEAPARQPASAGRGRR
jgi:hypothetical protein